MVKRASNPPGLQNGLGCTTWKLKVQYYVSYVPRQVQKGRSIGHQMLIRPLFQLDSQIQKMLLCKFKSCIKCHEEVVIKTITLLTTRKYIAESLSAKATNNRLEWRQSFLKILSNMKVLAWQGLPLRGDGDEADSNFMQLTKLRGEDDVRITSWLQWKTDRYTHLICKTRSLKQWLCWFWDR